MIRGGRPRALAWALLALAAAFACGGPAPVASPATARGALLWRADAPGRGVLYLAGSIHLGRADLDYPASMERAFEASDELVVEIDPTRLDPGAAAALSLRYAHLPPPESLDDVLSRETLALLRAHCEKRGIPWEGIAHLKPWFLSTVLMVSELEESGLDPERGVDRRYLAEAKGRKPIVALETVESQLAVLDGMSAEEQDLMLRDTLLRMQQATDETESLISAWQRGDEEGFAAEIFGPLRAEPDLEPLYDKLFFERNQRMADRLAVLARDGRTRFVVVGAGHMVGPRGIPRLLAKRGFHVVRVGASAP